MINPYRQFIGSNSYIGKYMQSCVNSETPQAYDFWAAIWLLSSVIGRNIIIPRPSAPVYLNWYIVLIARSGITRKSTCINKAVALLQKVNDAGIEILQGRGTPEAIENLLKKGDKRAIAIVVPELVRFFGKEVYLRTLPGLMTDIYDCPSERRSVINEHGSQIIKNAYPTLLGASTPVTLAKSINSIVIAGGLASRIMFICANKRKKRIAWHIKEDAPTDAVVLEPLFFIRDFIRSVSYISISENALIRFTKWYNTKEESVTDYRQSFEAREDDHVLKLAGFLALNDLSSTIQAHHITCAIRIINHVKDTSSKLFDAGMIPDAYAMGVDRVFTALLEHPESGIDQTTLRRRTREFMNSAELKYLTSIMKEIGMVAEFKIPAARGRPTTIWRMKSEMLNQRAISKLNEQLGKLL